MSQCGCEGFVTVITVKVIQNINYLSMANFSIGQRITARGEDFMVVNSQPLDNGEWVVEARGLSELVKDQYYYFDTNLDIDWS